MGTLPQKPHYRIDEAAKYCEVSRQTIYRWIDEGLLEAVRIGKKKLRVTRESLKKVVKPAF